MILVYAFALYYALACCVKIYDAIEHARGRSHLARANPVRAKRVPVKNRLPLPQPVPEDESWLYSHDDVLRFLSSSVLADFQSAPSRPGRLKASHRYHPLVPSEARYPVTGALKGSVRSSTVAGKLP